MTTPTPAEVGHRTKEPTVVEIDGFRGRLISADHADYDIARAVWNGAIDRRPHLIARCIGTADVVAAVRFARDHDLEIAIRGGGHNVAGTAICDDGIVIDLSAMRALRLVGSTRTARIAERSMTIPSSQMAVPATLWPPPRMAISRSWSRTKRTAATTSAVPMHRAIRCGRRSMAPFQTARATS